MSILWPGNWHSTYSCPGERLCRFRFLYVFFCFRVTSPYGTERQTDWRARSVYKTRPVGRPHNRRTKKKANELENATNSPSISEGGVPSTGGLWWEMFPKKVRSKSVISSTKGTIDPEGTRLLTVLYAYAKRRTHGDGQRRLIHRKTRNSCTGRSPVQSIGHARSCRRRVAAYWIEQTWRPQNCKYLPWLWTDLKTDFTNGFSVFFWS